MKILIDIPEEVKQKIDENLNSCDLDIYDCVMLATKNGTPLPKGHDRLIDAKRLKEVFRRNTGHDYHDLIDNAPTIIEAYGESEE